MQGKQLLARAALVVGGPTVFLLLSEIVLAFAGLPKAGADPNFAEMVRRIDAQEFFYDVDPDVFWRLRPNQRAEGEATSFRTNGLGFRGAEVLRPKPRGDLRVLLAGDSVTFGYGLGEEATFAHHLEEALSSGAHPVEVVNAGVPGYSSFQGRRSLERLVGTLEPDVVVASYGFNDARQMFASDAEVHAIGAQWVGARRLLYRLRTYRLLRSWIVPGKRGAAPAPVARVDPAAYAENLRSIVELVRAQGATPILLETPFQRDTVLPYGPVSFTLESPISVYRARAREVAQAEGVRYVGAGPLTERDEATNGALFLDPAHPSEAGARILAESLAVAIRGLPLAAN